MEKFRRIGVLTSGGDAPGMNAAVRAIVRAALDKGVEVMGIYNGYQGMIDDDMKLLSQRDVSNIIARGGTVLYSARCDEFRYEEGMQKAIANCKKNMIDGVIVIGGDGTFRGGTDLSNRGLPTIGVPGSIDNDVTASDSSIGFDTAMNTVVQMVDRLRDTCESHARCDVVEVMGRTAGHIAVRAGIAVGASAVAINEIPFDEEACIQRLIAEKKNGKHSFIVMVAEGNGDFAEQLTKRIEARTGIETRFARLAHVQRGGSPTLEDRFLATRMGCKAVDLLLEGKSNMVVCQRGADIVAYDINYAQTADRMYKKKLTEEQIAALDPTVRKELEDFCKMRADSLEELYNMAYRVAR
ncbi:MAG: 6-phosphofructokinase [Clostridia bacterium]|nr:6-phosphofructokinase [Clostridia bacterium]